MCEPLLDQVGQTRFGTHRVAKFEGDVRMALERLLEKARNVLLRLFAARREKGMDDNMDAAAADQLLNRGRYVRPAMLQETRRDAIAAEPAAKLANEGEQGASGFLSLGAMGDEKNAGFFRNRHKLLVALRRYYIIRVRLNK